MKILYLTSTDVFGGGQIYTQELANHFSKSESIYIIARKSFYKKAKLDSKVITYMYRDKINSLVSSIPLVRRFAKKLVLYRHTRIINKIRPNIVHFQDINLQYLDAFIDITEKIESKSILTAHTTGDFLREFSNEQIATLNRFDNIICVSEITRNNLIAFGVKDKICETIYNSVNVNLFRPTHNNRPSNLRIGWVGRISEQDKNPSLFIKIARESNRKKLLFRYYLFGDGPQKIQLKNIVHQDHLDNIKFYDFTRNREDIYKQIDILCMTSRSEAMPLVLLEALASGIPVVTSKVGGIPEVIKDNTNGYLVDNFKVEEYLEKFCTLSNLKSYNQISKEARNTTLNHFSGEIMFKKILYIYTGVLRGE